MSASGPPPSAVTAGMTAFIDSAMPASGALPSHRPGPGPSSSPRSSGARAVSSKKGRVLVVDDEPALVRSVSRVLERKGYETEAAQSGDEAARLLSAGDFDVVVSDIAMPGIDGIQLLKLVRARALEIPVVLITGEPAVSTAVKALEYGAFHYLTKPIDTPDLEEVIDKAVCLRRMTLMKRQAAELVGQDTAPVDIHRLQASFGRCLESLSVAYQPIVYATSPSIYGHEALLRSAEPSLPHPGAVLEAAEKLGRLHALGQTIRSRAAAPVREAPEAGVLFVNLHTEDLLDPTLLSDTAPLSKIADRVILEITERASLDRVQDVRGRIAALRELGFRIAVDDLGAGYAGLSSFALLEPEIVKLDMTLVRDIHLSATKQKLIRSITALCKDMGMMVVGEGVETDAERDTLVDLGCDLLQGYLFAKPGKPFPEVSW